MNPLPMRMRERIVELYDAGVKTKQIARAMGTCPSATRRIRQNLRERGTLEPKQAAGGHAGGLTAEVEAKLRERVRAEPGVTRQGVKDALGLPVDVRTVGRWLSKLGITLKKSRSTPGSRTART